MDLSKIQRLIGEDFDKVNSLIKRNLESEVEYLNTINSYLFHQKGKQIRPLLSLVTAKACGEINDLTICCAAVSEMVHTATLLHDDVADNSAVRRGAPTVHNKFSPASSILMGDFWLAKALSLLVKQKNTRILDFFTAAVEELTEGELFQMQKALKLDTTENDYLSIITRKTSSLFVATAGSSAYSAGADEITIEKMSRYAYNLGIAFQIRDDIFDYTPNYNTGKNTGSDIREKKITLPLIYAFKKANHKESDELLKIIKETKMVDDVLANKTIDFVNCNNGTVLAQETLSKYSQMAIDSLTGIKESMFKDELVEIAVYVGTRVI